MSSVEYNAGRYITVDEGWKQLGYTTDEKNKMSETTRARYLGWIKEANNKIEQALYRYEDVLPLDETSNEYSYAKSAAIDWLTYKKRDFSGSRNAADAKKDYESNIEMLIQLIRKRNVSTLKQFPINVQSTDSTANIIIPYSQSQGLPPDVLF